jgi:hypothetical protein
MTQQETANETLNGWVCSYRKMWKHPIFQGSAQRVGVWTWMLHMAAWKPVRFVVAGDVVTLERGQLCVSQRQMEEATGMGRQALRTFLDALEQAGAITRTPTHQVTQGSTQGATQPPTQGKTKRATQARTTITICKYDEYQDRPGDPTQSATQEPTQGETQPQPAQQPTDQPTKEQDLTNTPPSEGADAPPPEACQPVEISVVTTAVWRVGKQFLASKGVKNPGSIIGRWFKTSQAIAILQALEQAQRAGTEDPIPYITAVLDGKEPKGIRHDRSEQRRREDAATRELIRRVGEGTIYRGPDPSDPFAGG